MRRFLNSRPFFWFAMICGNFLIIAILLSVFGMVRTVKMPTSSMAPTIPSNSHVTIERFTYWVRDPLRGEIVTYKTDGIPDLPRGQIFLKRIIGLPNEHLVISNGLLLINSQPVLITNQYGPIIIHPLPGMGAPAITNLTIPPDSYFVIGDNTSNSVDSRLHGPIPRTNIFGLMIQ
jgi:signal peptidase I